jgi:hypothetical protein
MNVLFRLGILGAFLPISACSSQHAPLHLRDASVDQPAQPGETEKASGGMAGASGPRGSASAVAMGGAAAGASGHTAGTTQVVFAPTGNMDLPRSEHTATLLLNGKVLLAGGAISGPNGEMGIISVSPGAELYDPQTGQFTAFGGMTRARYRHTATLLLSGKVLITGGQGDWPQPSASASAELYDPADGTFTATGSMTAARAGHTATLLPNGQVLVVGENTSDGSVELFDPADGTFAATGTMSPRLGRHTSTLLGNGKALLAGNGSAVLFDSADGIFTATSAMTAARFNDAATLLSNGRVLITGGEGAGYQYFASAEQYDPSTGTFSATNNMTEPRLRHTATLLPSGQVLVAGGCKGTSSANVELYDPKDETFTALGRMAEARCGHTATLLPNSKVLLAGGVNGNKVLASAELYE